jgi:GTP-binding protein HflX
MTRADVIFDIFEQNATTSEGHIQVELARLNYDLPRVSGVGKELSRTGGDRGTRGGGGEPLTVLTKDRIRKRIRRLEKELSKVKRVRALRRKKRLKSNVYAIGLIGYTNSGKSSLVNVLTRSEEEVASRYFTTLDPAARRIYLGDSIEAVVTDTVGLLDDLPSELTTAFSATMEEVAESNLLLHLVDVSRENVEFRIESGIRILNEFGLSHVPRVVVFNKVDLLDDFTSLAVLQEKYSQSIAISTATGEGVPELKAILKERVSHKVQR